MLKKLRKLMEDNNIDAYIVPTSDPHGSEYIADYYKEREYITGFTGSAGTAVITKDKAKLWADGRYYIQAEKEIEKTGFELMKLGIPETQSIEEFLLNNLEKENKIGLNGLYFSQSEIEKYENYFKNSLEITDIDLIKPIFNNRKLMPQGNVFLHDLKYCGKKSDKKIEFIQNKLREFNCSKIIISSLEDICWILNIRGKDIEYTPVVISYLIIGTNDVQLYIDKNKLDNKVLNYLNDFAFIKDYQNIFDDLIKINNEKFYVDIHKINHKIYECISSNNEIYHAEDFISNLKTIKNNIEIANQKKCYIRDGVALTKFIYWLKKKVDLNSVNEYEVALKLTEFRKEQELYVDNSFETISAYESNAAMMHYSADKNNSSMLKNKGFLLVDSGGQYLDGTTDITRTITLGEITEKQKFDFTLVLKSHLALMSCKYLEGTSSATLDGIARHPIQRINYDYKCSTGHGVGHLLCVHELPPLISQKSHNQTISPGMIVSNEPGIYRSGEYGIRIENIMLCVEDIKNESGKFLKFESLSYAPIDLDAVDVSLLDKFEVDCLNEYHKQVYEKLSKYLNDEEKNWLFESTRKIGD